MRGARRADGTQVHLLAAMTGTGRVTAQHEVGGKTNGIAVFRPMLAPLDLTDVVVTLTPCTHKLTMPASWWRRSKPTAATRSTTSTTPPL